REGGVGQRSFDQDRATYTAVLLAQAAPITADYCSWAPLSRRRRGARGRRILRDKFEESLACSGDCLATHAEMIKMATAAYVLVGLVGAITLIASLWRGAGRGPSVPWLGPLCGVVGLGSPFP